MPAYNQDLYCGIGMLLEVISSNPSMTVLVRFEHLPGHLGSAMAMLAVRMLLKFSVC